VKAELSSPNDEEGVMPGSRPPYALLLATLAVAAALALPAGAAAHGCRHTPATGDPAVISDWNALAVQTFVADTTKAPQETPLYTAFVQAAVYDAVVGVAGRYEPYHLRACAPRGASAQAAAVTAAHDVIVNYSPYAQASVEAAYTAALEQIPDGQAKSDGVAFGRLAAADLIALRTGDGRNAPILFTQAPAPGVWRPTPPAFAQMAVPWMAFVRPLLVRSPEQFGDPGPPPALTSRRYTRDFAEVEALGRQDSTERSAEQTATAQFFSGNAAVQYNAALRNQATMRGLDIVDAARLFAADEMSMADAVISVWHAKYIYGLWRPVTAINLADTDGNPATDPDPSWKPLLATPPYPSYVSGYSGLTGAFTRALENALRTRDADLTLISTAVTGATRTYDTGAALRQDVIDARIWLGIHFRFDDTGGVAVGQRVARYALRHYFGREEDLRR
jgi:hypothetical protein